MIEPSYVGGCFCGSMRYQVMGKAENLCFCHCASCRRASGSPMVAWGTFARDKFSITQGHLVQYSSSPQVMRGFCGTCGTSLTYRHDGRPDEIDLALSCLDDPTVLVPESHIWVRDKLPWVIINDSRPQFDTVRRNDD